jgi:signal transduction histidine kinase
MLKRKDRTILPADAIASFFRIDGQLISTTVILRDISERHEKERRLRDYQARLKALAAELTVSEERERRRIAAVLHDGPVQTLAFARMQLGAAMQQADAGERTRALDEVSESLLQAGLDTSRVVADLASPILDELGLSAAISDWAQEQVHRRFGIAVRVQSDLAEGEERGLDELTRMVLFRNLRELLTNAVKHARATRIDIRLEQIEDAIRLSVGDDGAGCDVAAALAGTSDAGGFGLFSIRERMADLGGSMEIESSPGEGFTAVMRLPKRPKPD